MINDELISFLNDGDHRGEITVELTLRALNSDSAVRELN
jgi:hypothetical protein